MLPLYLKPTTHDHLVPPHPTMSVLATETLIQIFEHLGNPSDLFHVVQTCSVFHDIAIVMLYRHIQYSSSESFGAQTAFWEHAHDGMYGIPRSVALDNILKHPSQGVWRGDDYHDEDDEALQLQIGVWVRLLSFTSLHAPLHITLPSPRLRVLQLSPPRLPEPSQTLHRGMHLPGGATGL